MNWPNTIQSNTPAKYLFKLVTDTDSVICNPIPLEWKSGSLEMKRDLDSGGVMVSFICDSLTFVGNGAEFLRKLFEAYELNAKCTLIIYWWKEFDAVPANGRQYVEFPSRFDINFNFFEIVKIGRFFFGVKVKAINSSTQTKLDNRMDVDVDITKLTSIGSTVENNIIEYPSLKKILNYSATNVNYYGRLFKDFGVGDGWYLAHKSHQDSYTSIPLDFTDNSGFTEIQNVGYITKAISLIQCGAFFKNAQFNYEDNLVLDWSFTIMVKLGHSPTNPWTIQVVETNDVGWSIIDSTAINTYDLQEFGNSQEPFVPYTFTGQTTVGCKKGNDLKLVCRVAGIEATSAFIQIQKLEITEVIAVTPDVKSEGFPIYEAIERVSQHILDSQYPIYSDFFGRTDTIYNQYGYKYLSEVHERFAHLQSGMNQRGAKLYGSDIPLAINFKNLFKSLKALWNVGYSLESNVLLFGDEQQRIRVEEYAYFFKNTEVLDLSDRITKYDIQSVVMPELVPVDIKSGFDNFEYLSLNGRSEPNTTNQRTSIMNTSSKYENISPYRSDTRGILMNLANPLNSETGTADTKTDSSIFIVKSLRNGQDWIPEKGEYISVDNNSSLFKSELLNRYFTPSRMLIRQANKIMAGLTLYKNSVLRFQTSDKSSTLQTTGEGYTIAENSDILVSSLGNPIYKPMKHTINVKFTKKDLETLKSNMYGYLTFSNTISGFLLNLKMKNNEDKAEITIIERNIVLS